MSYFKGVFKYTVDKYCRVRIPKKIRDILKNEYNSNELYLTIFKDCLEAYPSIEWEKREKKFQTLEENIIDDKVRMFMRVLRSCVCDCSIDRAGRIKIPPTMKKKSGILNDVMIVGVLDHLEIWPLEKWEEMAQEIGNNLASIGRKLEEYGI